MSSARPSSVAADLLAGFPGSACARPGWPIDPGRTEAFLRATADLPPAQASTTSRGSAA